MTVPTNRKQKGNFEALKFRIIQPVKRKKVQHVLLSHFHLLNTTVNDASSHDTMIDTITNEWPQEAQLDIMSDRKAIVWKYSIFWIFIKRWYYQHR